MRLTGQQIAEIRAAVRELAGEDARVRLFGSRTNDDARGGDIDLLVEVPTTVTDEVGLSSRIAGRISRRLHGQKVDVLLLAPNTRLAPVHDIARREGVRL